ncbi:MAG: hypothetical protein ACE5IY_21275 [bacterium]
MPGDQISLVQPEFVRLGVRNLPSLQLSVELLMSDLIFSSTDLMEFQENGCKYQKKCCLFMRIPGGAAKKVIWRFAPSFARRASFGHCLFTDVRRANDNK